MTNPLLEPSPLPYGLPPFAQIRSEHYLPAFEIGCQQQLAEVQAIIDNPEPASFANTVLALENSGQLLDRVLYVVYNLSSSMLDDALAEVEATVSPALASHQDAIQLNPELFARIEAVYLDRDSLAETDRVLTERIHTDFVLAGARLEQHQRAELAQINKQLAQLGSTFVRNLVKDSEASAVLLDDEAELDGAPSDAIEAAKAAAAARGHHGKYLVSLVLPSGQPLLQLLTRRNIRERLYEASVNRASAGEYDNHDVARDMALLRAQAAHLLGFSNHAEKRMADQTAKTPQTVDEMLSQLVEPATRNARAEAEILQEVAAQDGLTDTLEPWDWAYYANIVAKQKYSVDTASLRPYFELERVLHDGVFFVAERLYGLTFKLREDLESYHPDCRIWEVFNESGTGIALYLGDYFARDVKRGGAWMSNFVEQNHLRDEKPVIVNCLNVPKAPDGQPTLLTLDEVKTLFHEFGHTLHGLLSDVTYPRVSGTNVPRDFVEFPSQVNEMWMLWPEVVTNYARHYQTGQVLGADVIQALHAAELWGQGYKTFEYLGATLLDQAWHRIGADQVIDDAADFEDRALQAAGMTYELIPPRYRTCYFQHIFSGSDSYSAAYYSYIWSEVLDADTVEWFAANGGLTRENGRVFADKLLSRGASRDVMVAVEDVLGRPPELGPLLRRRGLAT